MNHGEKKRRIMPRSHLLYGERTAAVSAPNRENRAVAAENLRRPQGRPTAHHQFLQAVGVAVELQR